jgi:prepilin-type N-terminal cleavage/methylation domain-containing protein
VLNTMKNTRKTTQRNFTLTEILVVCGIIVILMSIALGVYYVVQNSIAEANTKSIIGQIELAMESYKSEHGYNLPSDDTNYRFYLDEVDTSSSDTQKQPENNFIKYLPNYEKIIGSNAKYNSFWDVGNNRPRYYLTDGWGNPLVYRNPGNKNSGSYDLGSKGHDKQFGDNGGTTYTNFGEGDDITNFN